MSSRDVSHDVSPSPTTEKVRLVTLVSALRRENKVANRLLRNYRQLLRSTRQVMERRLPLKATKGRLINTCDKATIEVMVAELDKLEKLYSPHMAPAGEERVRGSLRAKADVPGPEEERVCTTGSLRAKADVPGPAEERGGTQGSLRAAEEPFGYIEGFRTNLGPVTFLRGPVKGYI